MHSLDQYTGTTDRSLWSIVSHAATSEANTKVAFASAESEDLRYILGSPSPDTSLSVLYSHVVERLRKQDRSVLKRLGEKYRSRLARIISLTLPIENTWQEFERRYPRGPHAPQPTTANLNAIFQESNDRMSRTDFGSSAIATHSNSLIGTSALDPSEHFAMGINTAVFYPKQFLKILPRVWIESKKREGSDDLEDRTKLIEVADDSIPKSLISLSRINIFSFLEFIHALNEKPLPISLRHASAEVPLNAGSFEISVRQNKNVLSITEYALQRCKDIMIGIGCPARYAKDSRGKSVILSLGQRFVDYWKYHQLPGILRPDGRLKTEVDAISVYNTGFGNH